MNFIAYFCCMAIVAPFWKGPADSCVPGIAESHVQTILKIMNPMKNEDYVTFLARKLGDWCKDWSLRA